MIELRDRLTNEVVESYETAEAAAEAYGVYPSYIVRAAECRSLPLKDWYYWSAGRAKQPNVTFPRCVLVSDGERIRAYLTIKETAADLGLRYQEEKLLAKDKTVRFVSNGKTHEAKVVDRPLVNADMVERVGGLRRYEPPKKRTRKK